LPSFDPQGVDAAPGVDVFTIEYDDQDVASETINGTAVKGIPIPKKAESFDGTRSASKVVAESYLTKKVVNSDNTISYYYSNGTVVTLESFTVTEFPDTDSR
jgi:hypothetical protein